MTNDNGPEDDDMIQVKKVADIPMDSAPQERIRLTAVLAYAYYEYIAAKPVAAPRVKATDQGRFDAAVEKADDDFVIEIDLACVSELDAVWSQLAPEKKRPSWIGAGTCARGFRGG